MKMKPVNYTPELLAEAVRGRFYRQVKQQVTARFDADALAWLKAGGKVIKRG